METLFRILFWLFALLYVTALAGIGGLMFGLVPFHWPVLSLIEPLGLPWNLFADRLPRTTFLGLGLSFWAGLLAPTINLVILYLLMRVARRKSA